MPAPSTGKQINSLGDVKATLERIVFDTEMKRNRGGLWQRAQNCLDYLRDQGPIPVYIVVTQLNEKIVFVELEDDAGRSRLQELNTSEFPDPSGLWRLGPLWLFPGKPGQQPAPGTETTPVSKDGKDDPFPSPGSGLPEYPSGAGTVIYHQLLIQKSGEADATCFCGKWRLLRMSAKGAPESPVRTEEILQAYNEHIKALSSS